MVYKVRLIVGGREPATCNTRANRRAFVAACLIAGMLFSLAWTVLALMHYTDPKLAEDIFCQQNKFHKEEMGQEDILNNTASVCNSSIVLQYTVEKLEPPLRAAYLAQAVTGVLLTAATLLALVGVLVGQLRLLLVWAAADVSWSCALAYSAAVLTSFGFPTFVPMLAGSAAAFLVLGCLVLGCGLLTKPDGQEHPDWLELSEQDPERGEEDPERGEKDPEPGEKEAETEESMSSRV